MNTVYALKSLTGKDRFNPFLLGNFGHFLVFNHLGGQVLINSSFLLIITSQNEKKFKGITCMISRELSRLKHTSVGVRSLHLWASHHPKVMC